MADLRPGDTVERYVVEARLGEGGMATVYRVRHAALGTVHALKVLHADSPRVRERMLQEGRLQASLRHPNVVPVTDVLEAAGEPALLVDYVSGGSLDDRLRARGPLPFAEAEALFRGILAGVAHAHAHGLVHRDLKPANVLMDGDTPRVADFGLAKQVGEAGATRTGAGLGTPAYMPPEQLRDARSVDARADLYALGALLYELLTGARAFPSPDVLETLNAAAAGRYRPLHELRAGVPPGLANAVDATLRPRPDDRPADCAALAAILDGAPPPPRPAPTWAGSFDGEPGLSGAYPPAEAPPTLPPAASPPSVSLGTPAGAWSRPEAPPPAPARPAPRPEPGPLPAALRSAPAAPESWPSVPSFHPPAPAEAPPLPAPAASAPAPPVPAAAGPRWGGLAARAALLGLAVLASALGVTTFPDAVISWHLPLWDPPPPVTAIVAMPDVGPSVRAEEARLVAALVDRGARAIVFAQRFEEPSPADGDLAEAFAAAEAAGVRVVVAADSPEARDRSPVPAPHAGFHGFDPLTLRIAAFRPGPAEEWWHLAVEALCGAAPPEVRGGWLVVGGGPVAPVDRAGRVRLRPWAEADVPRLDPAEVERWSSDAIAGRVVVIGLTGGTDGRQVTPFGTRSTPEVVAGAIETLAARAPADRPLQAPLATAAVGVGTALARRGSAGLARRVSAGLALAVAALAVALVATGADPLSLPWLPLLAAAALGFRVGRP